MSVWFPVSRVAAAVERRRRLAAVNVQRRRAELIRIPSHTTHPGFPPWVLTSREEVSSRRAYFNADHLRHGASPQVLQRPACVGGCCQGTT